MKKAIQEPARIDVFEARERVLGGEALLVNAYEPAWEFRAVRVEGAMPLAEFKQLLPTLSKDRKIIVYCA